MDSDNKKKKIKQAQQSVSSNHQKKMLAWLYFPSNLAMSIHISKLLAISVFVSPRYLTCHRCMQFPGNHGKSMLNHQFKNVLGNPQMFCKHLWVTGNIEGGYTWLPKHFNRKQILQTERKAVEQEGRLQKFTRLTPPLGWSLPTTACKEKLLHHKVILVPWPQMCLFNRFSHVCWSLHKILVTEEKSDEERDVGNISVTFCWLWSCGKFTTVSKVFIHP